MGLVNYVYPLGLLDEAIKLAEEITAQARSPFPGWKRKRCMQTNPELRLKFGGNAFASASLPRIRSTAWLTSWTRTATSRLANSRISKH